MIESGSQKQRVKGNGTSTEEVGCQARAAAESELVA